MAGAQLLKAQQRPFITELTPSEADIIASRIGVTASTLLSCIQSTNPRFSLSRSLRADELRKLVEQLNLLSSKRINKSGTKSVLVDRILAVTVADVGRPLLVHGQQVDDYEATQAMQSEIAESVVGTQETATAASDSSNSTQGGTARHLAALPEAFAHRPGLQQSTSAQLLQRHQAHHEQPPCQHRRQAHAQGSLATGKVPAFGNRTLAAGAFDARQFALRQMPLLLEKQRVSVDPFGWQRGVLATSFTFEFHVDDNTMTQLAKQCRMHVRAFGNNGADFPWQFKHVLCVNNQTVDVTKNQKKIRVKSLKQPFVHPLPADITQYVVRGRNTLTFRLAAMGDRGYCVVQLVQPVSADDMARSLTSSDTRAQSKSANSSNGTKTGDSNNNNGNDDADDDDIVEQGAIVSLFDPLSLARIKTPVRGIDCQHSQSFDLITYLSFSHSAQHSNCPVCFKPTPATTLVVDEFFSRVLSECGEDDDKVIIDGDSFFRLPNGQETRSNAPQHSSNTNNQETADTQQQQQQQQQQQPGSTAEQQQLATSGDTHTSVAVARLLNNSRDVLVIDGDDFDESVSPNLAEREQTDSTPTTEQSETVNSTLQQATSGTTSTATPTTTTTAASSSATSGQGVWSDSSQANNTTALFCAAVRAAQAKQQSAVTSAGIAANTTTTTHVVMPVASPRRTSRSTPAKRKAGNQLTPSTAADSHQQPVVPSASSANTNNNIARSLRPPPPTITDAAIIILSSDDEAI